MFGPKSPAYSIGTSKRDFSIENPIPGPASYNIPRDPLPRSLSFSKAQKKSRSISDIPGPGAYIIPPPQGHVPHAIIISRKPPKDQCSLPGPADYTPRDGSSSIKYTMTSRSNSKILPSNPGPGSYNNTQILLRNSPRATIGKAPRAPDNSEITPGPGSYNPQVVKPSVPRFSFPLTPRADTCAESRPGPGAYSYELSTNTGKTAVITPRRPATWGLQCRCRQALCAQVDYRQGQEGTHLV